MTFEVAEPILNSPFSEPEHHWYLREGGAPERRAGRRPSFVFQPTERQAQWGLTDGTLAPLHDYANAFELRLVTLIRERVSAWRNAGYPGATRTTLDLVHWWRRDDREQRLFFAQVEAAETIIFLVEARTDLRQGVAIPRDEPTEQQIAEGGAAWVRYACKMATGSGKTTVMSMLASWSILNKVANRGDGRFSDTVLVVCPNVTIRDRLSELSVDLGEASLYRKRDIVPAHLMPKLAQGRVIVTNWHVFEPQVPKVGSDSAGRVAKLGVQESRNERVRIGPKTTTARGTSYFTLEDFGRMILKREFEIISEERSPDGALVSALVRRTRWIESDTSIVQRVFGRAKGKQNILVFNDEAHHAYRIRRDADDDEESLFASEDEEDEFVKEATVWVEGLDRIHKLRGINFAVDLSATPFFLGRVGRDTGRPFPWTVSDFGIVDAIESGLVKIPQLAVSDTTGLPRAAYFNLWKWVMGNLTPAERGGAGRANPRAEAVVKWAHTPVAMFGQDWDRTRVSWAERSNESRPPVLIIVCKDVKLAQTVYEWIGEGQSWTEVPALGIEGLRNRDGAQVTVRVDSKVAAEIMSGNPKSDEHRWMRYLLDTVGRTSWPVGPGGKEMIPPEFVALAEKLGRPLHPPGRDIRCIVSVGMLTEGWDANTVTHVIGLRPFSSPLLCEQVVGRALRRASYQLNEDGRFSEEIAQVVGVPFDILPFKSAGAEPVDPPQRWHVRALPERAQYEIRFPRVESFVQAVRNRITVDWDRVAPVHIDPANIPPEVSMAVALQNNAGRTALVMPDRVREVSIHPYIAHRRLQQLVFEAAGALTRDYIKAQGSRVPAHALFPQLAQIVQQYVDTKVTAAPGTDARMLFLAPYYGWFIERLVQAIQPDETAGEAAELPVYERHRGPGSTADVSYWSTKPIRDTVRSHVNYLVADTQRWEQQAAHYFDSNARVAAWAKNAGLGFAIRYIHNGQPHEYYPDFIVRLAGDAERYLIVETKGEHTDVVEVKRQAAERWCAAVNADARYGQWRYAIAWKPDDIPFVIDPSLAAPGAVPG